jgi:hypothetical protein
VLNILDSRAGRNLCGTSLLRNSTLHKAGKKDFDQLQGPTMNGLDNVSKATVAIGSHVGWSRNVILHVDYIQKIIELI